MMPAAVGLTSFRRTPTDSWEVVGKGLVCALALACMGAAASAQVTIGGNGEVRIFRGFSLNFGGEGNFYCC